MYFPHDLRAGSKLVGAFDGDCPFSSRDEIFGTANFDGEGTDSRLERRARNWIGRVQFVGQQR